MCVSEQPISENHTASARTGPATGVLATIPERLPELTKSERKVARVVVDDPNAALNMSIARLAAAASVSEPTVMRFCAALGYTGYHNFRLALAKGLAFGVPATNSAIARDDPSDVIVDKIFSYTMSSLDHTRQTLDVDAIVQAIELMAGASELMFFGHGASQIIAQDAAQKFPLFGVPCNAPADSHQQYMTASMASPGAVAILISNTGTTASILDLAHMFRTRGVAMVGITGSLGPLTEVVDVALIVETLENTDLFTPTISRIASLVVIDILSTGVALQCSDDHVRRIQEMKVSLAEFRSGQS